MHQDDLNDFRRVGGDLLKTLFLNYIWINVDAASNFPWEINQINHYSIIVCLIKTKLIVI